MELTKHRISLDIHKQTTQAHLAVKKGDTARQIVASLSSCGVPYHIAEGCYAVFMGKKPEGNVLYNACTIEGDRIVYSFTEQTASAAGTMICELRLYGADGNLITSPRIALIVSGTVYEDTEVESADEYSALSELVAETLALRKKFPQPLSIDGVRYDGSEAVEVESSYTVSMDRMHDGTWVMMGSDEEIAKANAAGKPVYCRCFGRKLPLVDANGTYGTSYWNFVFAAVVDGTLYQVTRGSDGVSVTSTELAKKENIPKTLPNPHALTINGRTYDGSKEVTILDAPLVVHVDSNDNDGYGMDVSIDVIDSAYRTGRRLWCQLGSGVTLPFVTTYGGGIEYGYTFSGVDGGSVWKINVGTDGIKVTSSQVAFRTDLPTALPNPHALTINGWIYDGIDTIEVDTRPVVVTVNAVSSGFVADKTLTELERAHEDGRALYCNYGMRLPLVSEYGSKASLTWGYTFQGVNSGNEYMVLIGTDGIRAITTKLVPDNLPNPQPLLVNGRPYDGSAPVSVSVPDPQTVENLVKDVDTLGIQRSYVENLFNKDSAENVDGYLLENPPIASNGYSYSHLIPAAAGQTFFVTHNSIVGNYYLALFYSEDGAFATRTSKDIVTTKDGFCSFTVPDLAKIAYMRVCYATNNADAEMVVQADEAPPAYAPYGEPLAVRKVLKEWSGKTWVCVGDSLTEVNIRTDLHYFDYVAEKTGISVVNMGISGTGYKSRDGADDNGDAFYQRVANIPEGADVITIFGSGNDLYTDCPLGEVTDTGTETLCGCINTTLDNLFEKYPAARVGLVTPTPWKEFNPANTENAMELYSSAIVEICRRRSIPCLDLYHCSGLRPWEASFRPVAYSKDGDAGCHPDETGHAIIAPRFKAFLDTLII